MLAPRRATSGQLLRTTAIALGLSALGLFTRDASADVLLPGTKFIRISVSFTMEDKAHLVVYPSECPFYDLELNPHLRFVPDYDVLDVANPREPYKFCGEKAALWELDEAAFPKTKGPNPASFHRTEWQIEIIDKIPVDKRAAFFASTPGVRSLGYTMPAFGTIPDTIPLSEVRERVTVAQGKVAKAETTYVYTDKVEETLPFESGKRPQPTRKEARDWMPGLAGSTLPPPSASSTSGPAGTTTSGGPAANPSSCGCSVPGRESGEGVFLTLVLGVGIAAARRARRDRRAAD